MQSQSKIPELIHPLKFLVLEARPEETLRWGWSCTKPVMALQNYPGNLLDARLRNFLFSYAFS
jgi:hypothetical protein